MIHTWQVRTEDGSVIIVESSHAAWQGEKVIQFYNLEEDSGARTFVSLIPGVTFIERIHPEDD